MHCSTPSRRQLLTAGALLAVAAVSHAAQSAIFAAPAPQIVSDTASSAMRVPLALLAVLTMVLGAAWLMRRATGLVQGKDLRMQVLAQLQLGAREKAVMIRVSGQDVLLGVAPGNVRLLLASPSPAETADPGATTVTAGTPPGLAGSFREILKRSLGR
jgi:flagellar protein FliO/FliZ